jgi:hypothetical protein
MSLRIGGIDMTAQEQLNAFLEHCGQIRQGSVFSFKAKTSSLRNFIVKVEKQIADNRFTGLLEEGIVGDLKRTSPKDHVKYLPAIKSLAAVWGTPKDYVRLAVTDVQPSSTLYWDLVTGNLGTAPTKISISSHSTGYPLVVATHLAALNRTGAGHTLLAALAGSAQHTVAIVDHPLTNQCGTNGSINGMNKVTQELYPELAITLRTETLAALRGTPTGGRTPAGWLAEQINQTPEYVLKGVPAVAPRNLRVTEAQVQAWITDPEPGREQRAIWDDFRNDAALEQIKRAIIIALYPRSTPGTGCSSTVNYSLGTTNPLNAERPPAIGLAHELVHAYYNMRGEQPGFEVDHPTTVLFEYRCVGLGPWSGAAVSENAIRNDWSAALLHFDEDDARNRKNVEQRPYYSPA